MAEEATHALTRRRALALGAATGLGAAAGIVPAAAGAAGRPARPLSFALRVGRSAFAAAGGTTDVLAAPRRFDLVGVAGAGTARAGLELRARPRGGRFSAWVPLAGGADHAPDHPRVNEASDPIWVGGADELQLRARHGAPARGVQLRFVAVPARAGAGVASPRAASPRAAGVPTIIPRAAWGAAAVPPRAAPEHGTVQMAFVHHTVSANAYEPQDSAGIVLGIAKYHRDSNGWNDIGYNFLVDQYGQVFEGRAGGIEAAIVGAQAAGWNSVSTGMATIGTFESVAFPEAGQAALVELIAWKLALHGVPVLGSLGLVSSGGSQNRWPRGASVTFQRVSGHRDGCTTSCPGSALYAQLPALRTRAAALAPVGPALTGTAKLTLAATAPRLAYGSDLVITGRLVNANDGPLGGVAVSVQKRGSSSWTTVARATTAADGSFTARLPWRAGGQVRAAASVGGADLRSPGTTVAIDPLLSVGRLPTRVQDGRSLRVHGRVRPAGAVSVLLERQGSDGAYRRSSLTTLRTSGGRFDQAVRAKGPGLYRVTVRTTQDGGTTSAPPSYLRVVRRAADVGRSASGGAAPGADPSGGMSGP